MVEKLSAEAVEKLLTSGPLTVDGLNTIAGSIEALRPFQPTHVFPIGIVAPDTVRVRVSASPSEVKALIGGLAGTGDPIKSWRVFPIGIVAPERFEIEVDIGRRFGP